MCSSTTDDSVPGGGLAWERMDPPRLDGTGVRVPIRRRAGTVVQREKTVLTFPSPTGRLSGRLGCAYSRGNGG